MIPDDHVSPHYLGHAGQRYFQAQQRGASVKAAITSRKFAGHVNQDDVVLDYGCADGGVLDLLRACGKVGIEVNPANVALARKRGLRVVESLDEIESALADVAISHHALEHTRSPFRELRGIARTLKPGGRAILVVPTDDWRAERRPEPSDINHHLYTWTPLLFAHLLGEAGFAVGACQVVHRCIPGRLTVPLATHHSPRAFDMVCFVNAVRSRRREILTIASKRAAA